MRTKKKADALEKYEQNRTGQNQPEFSKEQILESIKYADRKDLISALLDNDKKYTFVTVDKMIEDFMKGQVK